MQMVHMVPRLFVLLAIARVSACPGAGAERGAADTAGPGGAAVTGTDSASAARARGDAAVVVKVMADVERGAYLTDGRGRALYLFEQDRKRRSTCDGECALAWPPVVTRGVPRAGDTSVRSSMLSTVRRRDGRVQVTYGGWPLYYDAVDTRRGDTGGQNVDEYGATWYLVTPSGRKLDGSRRERTVASDRTPREP